MKAIPSGTINKQERGEFMSTEVQVIEGGQVLRTEKMKLTFVKDFSGDITLYENEDGRAVIYFKKKDDYVLVSIDMA